MNEFMYYVMIYGMYIIYGIIVLTIMTFIFKANILTHHSNWSHLIDGMSFSTEEFYQRLKAELLSHGIKGVSTSIIHHKEGSVFSSSRRYLRVEWKEYRYDMCAAPFGKGFFVSWWLLYKNSILKILLGRIPFVGGWIERKWFPLTFWKVDSASMFMTYCHQSVQKVIADITKEKGVRSLTEQEQKPILNNIFKR